MNSSLNDQTINTLKEISDLKNEILKLTSSLKHLQNTPDKDKVPKIPKYNKSMKSANIEDMDQNNFDT